MTDDPACSSKWSRRDAIRLAGGALLCAGCGFDLGVVASDDFDDVLDRLHGTDPELDGGLSNHAPMAIEALVALSRPERVVAFLSEYDGELRALARGDALPPAARPGALGDRSLRADWIATYAEELSDADPRAIVARDFSALASGMAGASFHGLLRMGHAVRSLERADTASRRRELAHGMGYWSAVHTTLPGTPGGAAEAGFGVASALEAIPLVPSDAQIHGGLIQDRLGPAIEDPRLEALIERVDLDAMPHEQALTELCAAAARVFVAEGGSSISLLHAITGPSALRLMWGWLDDPGRRLGLGHALHVALALVSAQASAPPPTAVAPPVLSAEQIAERSAASQNPHAIKLGEAAIREYAIDPRPELLRAAELWLDA